MHQGDIVQVRMLDRLYGVWLFFGWLIGKIEPKTSQIKKFSQFMDYSVKCLIIRFLEDWWKISFSVLSPCCKKTRIDFLQIKLRATADILVYRDFCPSI